MTTLPAPLLRSDHGPCAVLTLNRPAVLNAIDDAMLDALDTQLDAIERDSAVRALVFTGNGRAFCAGSDLRPEASHGDAETRIVRMHALVERLRAYPKVSVAALNGLALGGGLEIPLACTFRIAAPGAQMGLPEVKLGLIPVYGGTALLPTLVGENRALEMMLSGDAIDAATALQWGLLSAVATDATSLLTQACALAQRCSRHSLVPQQALRRLMRERAQYPTLRAALVAEHAAGQTVIASADAQEGLAAFVQKRKPVFKDR